jgi:hypothetical protein
MRRWSLTCEPRCNESTRAPNAPVFPFRTPPGLRWDHQASDFLDALVDLHVDYLSVQAAVERLIHAGLHEEITAVFVLDGFNIHLHRVPPLFPEMRPLHVFTTVRTDGLIDVFHICFADRRGSAR